MNKPKSPPQVEKNLFELFSDPRVSRHAYFSYPIEGPSEAEKAVDAAIKEMWPEVSKEHEAWVREVRTLGLIVDQSGCSDDN